MELATRNPAQYGELKIFNQLTETFTVLELAENVKNAALQFGLSVQIKSIENPRKERENHYYNPKYSGLLELGLTPNYMTESVLGEMIDAFKNKDKIDISRISQG